MDIKYIRFLRLYFNSNQRPWISNITNSNQLYGDLADDEIAFNNTDEYQNIPFIKISLRTNTFDNGLSNDLSAYNENSNLKYLMYFAICQIIKRSLDDPTAVFSSMTSINNSDVSTFNSHFNLSLTNQDYLDFINILITDLKSEILNNSSLNLELKIILNTNLINVIPQNSQVTPYIKL